MKHCLPDPVAEERLMGRFTVFSCEFDNGRRASGTGGVIRLGEDGKIMLFLCQSCLEQLNGQILHPIVLEAVRSDPKLLREITELGRRAPEPGID